VRGHAAELEHVLVVSTLGAPERRGLRGRGRRRRPASPEPAPVTTGRVTLVTAQPFYDDEAAESWLRSAGEDEVQAAVATLNRVLHMHRAATADPHVRELRREQAVVVRVGYGEGDHVAEGRWVKALELPTVRPRPRRDAALRPQERLSALLGGRDAVLACEELALRARQDVDAGRRREAALQLDAALTVAPPELEPWSPRGDIGARVTELRELHIGVRAAALAALQGGVDDGDAAAVQHALERLEAALRARTALGFD
jgi:hypothetical protein